MTFLVATTSLPAVDRPNADRWNAARSRQLFNQVQKLATSRHVRPENFDANEPLTEYFPSLPLHLGKVYYKVDKEDFPDDETIEDDCNKDYPRALKITPGLAHIFCRHGICKGFVSMTTAESP